MSRAKQEKINTVVHKNTFFYYDADFEEKYEIKNVTSVSNLLTLTYSKVCQANGPTVEIYDEMLLHPFGLKALLTLTGVSYEMLQRIITLVRVVDDPTLGNLVNRSQWVNTPNQIDSDFSEWSKNKIQRLITENAAFRRGIVNLFFAGASDPFLSRTISPFHLKKFSVSKLSFNLDSLIDTLVRYREGGSRSAMSGNNAEQTIKKLLGRLGISFETGDLPLLVEKETNRKRTMDFIIPNKQSPLVILECSYMTTTSSNQGDKSKTEQGVSSLIKEYYPHATFIGLVDGIGWYVRRGDLARMVEAYDDVFTLDTQEQLRFTEWLSRKLS